MPQTKAILAEKKLLKPIKTLLHLARIKAGKARAIIALKVVSQSALQLVSKEAQGETTAQHHALNGKEKSQHRAAWARRECGMLGGACSADQLVARQLYSPKGFLRKFQGA
jgi:hypothetical protein